MSIFAAMALEEEVQRLAAERDAALARAEEVEAALDTCWGKLDDMTAQRDALRIAYDDQAAGRNKAEVVLAQCQHDLAEMIERKEYFRRVWEVAEAELAAMPVAELRRLAELRRAHQWSSVEGPVLWATVEAWLEAQP